MPFMIAVAAGPSPITNRPHLAVGDDVMPEQRHIEVLRQAGISLVGMPGTGYKLPPDFVPIPATILKDETLERPAWLKSIDKQL